MGIQRGFLALCLVGAACTGVGRGGPTDDAAHDDESDGDGAGTGGASKGGGSGGKAGAAVPQPGGGMFDGHKPFDPGARAFRRLTNEQFVNAVSDILRVTPELSGDLNDDRRLDTFANDETQSDPSGGMVQAYERAATKVAAAATAPGHRAMLFDETKCASKESCIEDFATEYGRLFFRHGLNASEKTPLVAAGKSEMSRKGGDFWAGAQIVLEILLQSPSFLYGIDEATAGKAGNGYFRRTPEAIATRLALVLWSSVPDRVLLDQVAAGALDDDAGVLEVARAMVERERGRFARSTRHFLREWLGYDLVKHASKDPSFVEFNPMLTSAMVRETDALVEHFAEANLPIMKVFDADFSFADDRIQAFYGGSLASMGNGKVKLPAARRGVLGHASFIAVHSAFERHSPTLRGKTVLERYLCGTVGEPPPDAPAELPASQTMPETVRERTERYMLGDKRCNFCHNFMDGLGFAFEHFDAIGKYREVEAVAGAPDGKKNVNAKAFIAYLGIDEIDGLPGLAQVLATRPEAEACMVRNVFGWSMGRRDDEVDAKTLADMHQEYLAGARSLRDLFFGLVKSGALTYLRAS